MKNNLLIKSFVLFFFFIILSIKIGAEPNKCVEECSPECDKKCLSDVRMSILGVWYNKEKDAKINLHLCKENSKNLCGTITWILEPFFTSKDSPPAVPGQPRTDVYNPDESKRKIPNLGLTIIKSMAWVPEKKHWTGGDVYDPKNGKTYGGALSLVNTHKLKLRGHLKCCRLLGRTDYWTR